MFVSGSFTGGLWHPSSGVLVPLYALWQLLLYLSYPCTFHQPCC
jgi:hypothetical protein